MTTLDPRANGGAGSPPKGVGLPGELGAEDGGDAARAAAEAAVQAGARARAQEPPAKADVTEADETTGAALAEGDPCLVDDDVEPCKFIPVSRFDLIEALSRPSAWPEGEAENVVRFFRYLGAWRNLDYTEKLMRLKEAYLPFSPDRDTVRGERLSAEELARHQATLIALVTELLEQANYRRIDKVELQSIFSEQSAYGLELEVDLDEFEELLIYARGTGIRRFMRRSWKTLWLRKEPVDVPFFQRLFLLLKLKPAEQRVREIMAGEHVEEKEARKILKKRRKMLPDGVRSDYVYLKLFKEIARADLEMMFPNTRVQFRPFDKIKLAITAGGGTVASLATTVSKVLIATNPMSAAGALLGLVMVIFRQVMKFFNTRTHYMMVLAQNLYFHNLADSRGALTLLCDRAEEEDIKEEYLLYCLLAKGEAHRDQIPDMKAAIEDFLETEFKVRVDYDIYDALGRLIRDEIVTEAEDGTLRAIAPEAGCLHVDARWDEYLNTAEFYNDPRALLART